MVYQHKPTIVTAEQFDPEKGLVPANVQGVHGCYFINTQVDDQIMMIKPGDWVVRSGEKAWVVEGALFPKLYVPVPGAKAAAAAVSCLLKNEILSQGN